MNIKQYSIFLASSFELQPERKQFEIFIGRQNKRLLQKNVQLRLEIWEDMGAELNHGRKQDDYNKILETVEIVVLFFWTKMGKFTREEFDLAYQRFLETGKPLIYVYEKTEASSKPEESWEKQSIANFLEMLLTPGKEQFHSTFTNYGELEAHFLQTLINLFADNLLSFGERSKLISLKGPLPPSFFIGREKELETISEKFKEKGQLILLSAEGGIGKTTLASKYWYENQYSYINCAYLFCEGGIFNAIMGDGLGMDLTGLPDEDRHHKVHRLFNSLGEDFLLFLDNANDAEDIQSFLQEFKGLQANLMITSRCRDVLTDKESEMVLERLSPKEAKTLFLEYYRENTEDFEKLLDRFLEGLNYHTLLIEVFAKNLKEASELGMDLKGFLGELEANGLILEEDNNFEIRSSYSGNVNKKAATTNDILEILYDFNKLSEEQRLFMVNMSFLPSENYILEFLLELFKPINKRVFRDILKNLYRNGWIGGVDEGDKPHYRLSPVIQSLVHTKNRESLWEDGQPLFLRLEELLKYEQEKDNTHTKFKWVSFGKYFIKQFKENNQQNFFLFLNDFALILKEQDGETNLLEAKGYLEKALSSAITNFGDEAPETTKYRSNLALVLKNLGGERNLLEAKNHLEKALYSNIANFGEDDPRTSISLSNLAMVHHNLSGQANLLKAKDYLEMALASDIQNFGEDSFSTAINHSNLAWVLREFGGKQNLLEAKYHLEKALFSDIVNFGEDSPSTAISRSQLGLVLKEFGGEQNLLEAKSHLEKALFSIIAIFGEDAPVTALRRSNLSLVLLDLGGVHNLLDAKGHLEKALITDTANFGENAPTTSRTRTNLAGILRNIGGQVNLLEANDHFRKALSSNAASLGKNHSNTILSMHNLAGSYFELGGKKNLIQALQLFDEALKGCRINFGEDYYLISRIIELKKLAEKKLND